MPDFHTSWQDIPIFTKSYSLYKAFYQYLPSFPKKDRYTLGQRIELTLLDLIEGIVVASNLSKQEKLPILKNASTKIDVLRVLLKLGKDLKVIENKNYVLFENDVNEIGKMLGGWIKTTNS